jgi:hypothetical protein
MPKHRFVHGQRLTVVNDDVLEGQPVEVAALLDHRCSVHNALCYGCIMSGDHISICEEQLAPMTSSQKRKLN